ncbi:MAG TPA: preprotein translocase subunit SecA, partial [Solirubrobacterales bacterium]|nr:preprotein translocase subunit SecA [Solirubrobacterales bacterium]
MSVFQKILRAGEGRTLKRLHERVQEINALEDEIAALSDDALRAKTEEFRERYDQGEDLDDLLPEAFACVREASKRTLGLRHFDVQLIGGMVLHEGRIAEMKTGEGKTLVATLALYLNAIAGVNVHLVTVNDYLAKRDAEWMGPIYEALGMTVGVIQSEMADDFEQTNRRAAYACDITYGTNSEFGFDYLRDNMAVELSQTVQRGHWYAIVDEVDSILIDEARTPLIISGQPEQAADTYYAFARAVGDLEPGVDYEVDEKFHTAAPTEEGVDKVEKAIGVENLYAPENGQLVNHLIQALKAKDLYKRDDEYVVMDGEVKIVDEFTGRIMEGRRWSEGLHQAVEAKEGVRIQEENVTVATVTIQNYFRLYTERGKLAGMTGTALTEANEFHEIYGLEVVPIPTHRPMVRVDQNDQIYRTKDEKFSAVVEDIVERHGTGQPVLVGTISVEVSEHLSKLLDRRGIPHEVLNAKNHEREALIIQNAGERGAVTIATNMAGRGVDIKLANGVPDLGGLYVLGTERHESRRIDNQLRGRSGRQGDPGESRFYLSAQDEVIRLFAGERIYKILDSRFGPPDGEPIEAKMLTSRIEGAQKKVEEFHFVNRKNVVKYDDVMNEQRKQVYATRREILEGGDLRDTIVEGSEDQAGWVEQVIEAAVDAHTTGAEFA